VQADEFGVATVQFPTSAEPTLGTWTIEAFSLVEDSADEISSVTAFSLDRYVLPKFEVTYTLKSKSQKPYYAGQRMGFRYRCYLYIL
jgi:uncharacterized protein YfaS (alpha-2-macroglobulin family)